MFNAIEIPKALQNDEVFIGLLFKKFKFIKEIEINFCINDEIIEAHYNSKLKLILWLQNSNLKTNAELTQISRFVNLEELNLTIDWFETNEIMLDKELILIGKSA
jgi:hypothetical protein